ncbi:hypothetical protein L7F22_004775 [Adiantum nelumboides]|nr:hypothetical protein [Adiantum nelumboides]
MVLHDQTSTFMESAILSEPFDQPPEHAIAADSANAQVSAEELVEEGEAAVVLQKTYRSYRTRRQLADCAVMHNNYAWWNVLEGVLLQQRSEAFYAYNSQDTAASRWARLRKKAAKVGKGLSKDENARKLAIQHWLEAIDPRHRYGHNLHFYYTVWEDSSTKEPFFYWLDVGEGKDVDLPDCKRTKLQKQQIKYLGPKERKEYEVVVEGGKLRYKKSRELVHTPKGDKWIFVMSASGQLYVAQKQKGIFQHSSFLAGGAAKAAGRLLVNHGTLELMEAHSGHYRPTQENFSCLVKVLEELGTDFSVAKVQSVSDDMLQKYPSGRVSQTSDSVKTEEIVLEGVGVPESNYTLEELEGLEEVDETAETREGTTFKAMEGDRDQGAGAFEFQVHVLERRAELETDVTRAVSNRVTRQVSLGDLTNEEADIARLVLVPPESSERSLDWISGVGPRIASLQGCPL